MKYDVLISGAGPTGIMAANLLGKAGVSVAVFDKEADIYPLPRAAVIDDDIARIFQHAGLADVLSKVTSVSKGYRFLNQEHESMFGFVRNETPSMHGYPTSFCIRQPEVEKVLRNGLLPYENVTLFSSHEVVGVEQLENEVELTVLSKEENETKKFVGSYVIAADGARSFIRKSIGITFEDLKFDYPWLILDFEVTDDLELETLNTQYCIPSRPVTFLYLGKNLYRYEIMLKPDETPESLNSEEAVREILKEFVDPNKVFIERFVTYTFHALIASKWRENRIFLAGDAAHQMPPFLGQGLSSGIRDAANIAWKLEHVVKFGFNDKLLNSYQEERYPHVHNIMKQAIALGNIIQAPAGELADFRDAIFKYLNSIPNIHQALNNIERSKSPIGKGLHHENLAATETLACPQFLVDGQLSDELIKRQFTLFVHPTVDVNELTQAYAKFNIVQLPDAPEVTEWFANKNATIAVLRPDSYVYAYATNQTIDQVVADLEAVVSITDKRGVVL